jgi:hypothetical protein
MFCVSPQVCISNYFFRFVLILLFRRKIKCDGGKPSCESCVNGGRADEVRPSPTIILMLTSHRSATIARRLVVAPEVKVTTKLYVHAFPSSPSMPIISSLSSTNVNANTRVLWHADTDNIGLSTGKIQSPQKSRFPRFQKKRKIARIVMLQRNCASPLKISGLARYMLCVFLP